MIVAFHSDSKLDCIIVLRSFAHTIERLTILDYFRRKQITFIDPSFIKMLKDMAFEVSKRRCKNSIGQMFSMESALVKKTLLNWFNQKFKRQLHKINPIQRLRYESQNPINWETDKCVICKFQIKRKLRNHKTPDNELSFGIL